MICPKCEFDGKQMHYCLRCGNGLNLPPTPEEKVFTASDMQKREAQFTADMKVSEEKYEDLAKQHDALMQDYAELKEELSKATATPPDSKLESTPQIPMEPAPPSGVTLPQ